VTARLRRPRRLDAICCGQRSRVAPSPGS
jgi:hypothetical protein